MELAPASPDDPAEFLIDPLTLIRASASKPRRDDWTALGAVPRWYNAVAEFGTTSKAVYVTVPKGASVLLLTRYFGAPNHDFGRWPIQLERGNKISETAKLVGYDEYKLDYLLFGELVSRLGERLLRRAVSLGSREPEERVNDALQKIWKHSIRTGPPTKEWALVPWIYEILKQRVDDERKSSRKDALRHTVDADDLEQASAKSEDGRKAQDSQASLDLTIDVNTIYDRLSSRDKSILRCRGIEKRQWKEIENLLGVNERTARRWFDEACARFRQLWMEQAE